ncbi:CU044_5270 family protein [Streptomyces sp. NPDC085931]|uniref:CU044_5270 family protein n=1 Tax=Streptomyces sp. NPDC085931 TaxID=3365740 RepID=UPI0037D7D8BE
MADELDLLRSADPVPSHGHRFGDGPLDRRAEHRLERLLSGADEPPTVRTGQERPRLLDGPRLADRFRTSDRLRPSDRFRLSDRLRLWLSGRLRLPGRAGVLGRLRLFDRLQLSGGSGRAPAGHGRLRLVWGLVATALVTALTLTLVLNGPSTPPALAAPRPLVIDTGSAPVPLDRLAERAAAAAGTPDAPRLRKGTHVRSWSLGMSDDGPPVTLPEERLVRWRPDGSHTELVVATDPRHPARPVLSDADGTPRLVGDGRVLLDRTYPPSWSDAPPQSPPPRRTDRLRAYLAEAQYTAAPLTTPQLLDAVATLLDHWTLGARESAALARLLADAEGLRPAGRVTDRLGRRGQAYVTDTPGVRHMLIMDPATGAVLGLESTLTAPDPEYGVDKGAVLSYSAWTR